MKVCFVVVLGVMLVSAQKDYILTELLILSSRTLRRHGCALPSLSPIATEQSLYSTCLNVGNIGC